MFSCIIDEDSKADDELCRIHHSLPTMFFYSLQIDKKYEHKIPNA
jgi:hypothetical protein